MVLVAVPKENKETSFKFTYELYSQNFEYIPIVHEREGSSSSSEEEDSDEDSAYPDRSRVSSSS